MEKTVYFAKTARLPHGWAENVVITVDTTGWITQIESNQVSASNMMTLDGPVIPGMPNVHSHAFQRGMAGLAERVTTDRDSFWTWRETMYGFLKKLTPEDQHAIAAQVYVEMLKAGYTTVGEFHYLHHQANGQPYEERSLTSIHLIDAAMKAGIAITHLPVLYAYSGMGSQAPKDEQKRFINNDAEILEIISALFKHYQSNEQVTIGLAHHSLRAVNPEMLHQATLGILKLVPRAPIHIHVAEQIKEVNDCVAWSGKRPVEWLLSNVEINKQWCLVHATQMTEEETHALALSGAVVGLCPTTEANLGDGFFNLPVYLQEKGSFGIGSDSHISVNMIEELRLLEYGQRLLRQKRAVTRMENVTSTGAALYQLALQGGAQALGRDTGAIQVGKRADFLVLDAESPALFDKKENRIFDAMLFATNVNPIRHVIAGGKQVVKDFHHLKETEIFNDYAKTMKNLNLT